MRLEEITIKQFKNLKNFCIDFDNDSATTVLVGRNGSGKSNLLEALTIIFRDLDLSVATPSFAYELDYVCSGHNIHIDADPDRERNRISITVDGQSTTLRKFSQNTEPRYLPRYVFGYYSGPSNRLEEHFEPHQERFYRDLLKNVERPLRPLFYARPVHSQFVLLAFFNEKDEVLLKFLKEHMGIEGLESVLFIMRQPSWKSREGDERFWNSRGVVQGLLDKLYTLSLAPLRLDQRIPIGFRRSTTKEHLYLYLKDLDAIQKLSEGYADAQAFFKALESTYISELISEVRIRVKAHTADDGLIFRELSEGEQQLLMVLGLMRFTREDESLFLLDEPDTHLNPAWSVQYLNFLKDYTGAQDNNHIIIATHDPLVVAGLTRSQVRILRKEAETGEILAETPEQDPKGMGVAALLTSDVYGLRSQLDLETMALLDQKRKLAVKETLTSEEEDQLKELNERLEGLDFTTEIRDPLYSKFVKAMAALEQEKGLQKPVLTKEEQAEQMELAFEILKKIKEEEDSTE